MRILYYSVHAVLEDDEVRMFRALGHDVFPLGVNFGFTANQPFRESIAFGEEERALLDQFHATGCAYQYGPNHADATVLTKEFVSLFDMVVVMHDLTFINRFWPVLATRPVVWRTIGQNIDGCEGPAALLRDRGMHIVRYSPAERYASSYCGETALIRFAKDPSEYGPWTGTSERVLTFCNLLAQRYPDHAAAYCKIVDGLPSALGGVGNESLPGQIGFLSPEQQRQQYSDGRAYLYCSGPEIPYTLNFIEALMSGMPIVATDFAPTSSFYEIPSLLKGDVGIVANTVEHARDALAELVHDHAAARAISTNARAFAVDYFSTDRIAPEWQRLFERIA